MRGIYYRKERQAGMGRIEGPDIPINDIDPRNGKISLDK
jgi:hypothetical protein